MLINKLQQNLIIKQLCSRHTLMALISCVLLVICGLLSGYASAVQQTVNATESSQATNMQANLKRFKQDPTRPPSMIVQQLAPELAIKPAYELTAIFTRNNRQYAVVNGNVVKTGDPVANMRVAEISGSNLTLQHATSSRDIMVLELSGAVTVKTQVTK